MLSTASAHSIHRKQQRTTGISWFLYPPSLLKSLTPASWSAVFPLLPMFVSFRALVGTKLIPPSTIVLLRHWKLRQTGPALASRRYRPDMKVGKTAWAASGHFGPLLTHVIMTGGQWPAAFSSSSFLTYTMDTVQSYDMKKPMSTEGSHHLKIPEFYEILS